MRRQRAKDAGFSLIELIITMSILIILTGMIFLGTGTARRKETDRYSRDLCNEIRLTRTVAMSKAGKWRLCLYLQDGDYYCVKELETEGTEGTRSWEAQSEVTRLGHEGAVNYEWTSADPPEAGDMQAAADSGTLICVWRFNRDTGACMNGAGTLKISGMGKVKEIAVYGENGYCEEK